MSMYRASAASVALCSGLLLASFIMAEQTADPVPSAQMNRTQYIKKAAPEPAVGMPRRPVRVPVALPVPAAQMNRALYRS